jgi:hypothetical protein
VFSNIDILTAFIVISNNLTYHPRRVTAFRCPGILLSDETHTAAQQLSAVNKVFLFLEKHNSTALFADRD